MRFSRKLFASRLVFELFLFFLFIATSSYPAQLTSEFQNKSEEPTASQNTDTTQPSSQPSRWHWSFSVRNRTGLRISEPRLLQMSRTFMDVKSIYKLNDQCRLTIEGRSHYDPVGRLGYPKKPWFDPRQFLMDIKTKDVNLSLGLQQIVWGQADGLMVLDVINPLDYREFILEDFIDTRRPLWALRADMPIEKGFLQLIWVPYFASALLPEAEHEFGLGNPFGLGLISSVDSGSGPETSVDINIEPTQRPSLQLGSSQIGARYSRSIGGWDLTMNYFYGWEEIATPYLRFTNSNDSHSSTNSFESRITITPRFDHKTIFGGTATTNFGPLVLRMEVGYNPRKSSAVFEFPPRLGFSGFEKFGYFSSVIGLDYSPLAWLWLSGQYFLQFISGPQRSLLFPRYNHLASFYLRTIFFGETIKAELFILTGLNHREYMIRPRLVRSLTDHLSVSLGIDFLGGSSMYPFGFFKNRDRLVAELRWMK